MGVCCVDDSVRSRKNRKQFNQSTISSIKKKGADIENNVGNTNLRNNVTNSLDLQQADSTKEDQEMQAIREMTKAKIIRLGGTHRQLKKSQDQFQIDRKRFKERINRRRVDQTTKKVKNKKQLNFLPAIDKKQISIESYGFCNYQKKSSQHKNEQQRPSSETNINNDQTLIDSSRKPLEKYDKDTDKDRIKWKSNISLDESKQSIKGLSQNISFLIPIAHAGPIIVSKLPYQNYQI